jgi:hypothetical protein
MADPELLSLRQYVALFDVKVAEAIDKLKASDAGDYRQNLLSLWEQLEKANAERIDPDDPHAADARAAKAAKVTDALNAIGQTIRDAAVEEEAWREVSAAIKDRMAATAAEYRRLVDLEQVLTIEQAAAFILALHRAVKKTVDDPKIRSEIAAEIDREVGFAKGIIQRPPAPEADPSE